MAQFSNAERLAILVTASCRPDLKDKFVDVSKVAKLVASGDEWAIRWEYEFLEEEAHPLDPIVEETRNIFDMFLHLQLTDPNVLASAGLTAADIAFSGFDGNNDQHYHIAKVLVDDLERYDNLPGATTNSHTKGSLPQYRNLLQKYLTVKQRQASYSPLSTAELSQIF